VLRRWLLIERAAAYYSSRRSGFRLVSLVAERSLIGGLGIGGISKAEDLRVQVGSLAG